MCPCGDNTDTYVYTHVHTHVYTHVHICVCTHIHTCVPSSSFGASALISVDTSASCSDDSTCCTLSAVCHIKDAYFCRRGRSSRGCSTSIGTTCRTRSASTSKSSCRTRSSQRRLECQSFLSESQSKPNGEMSRGQGWAERDDTRPFVLTFPMLPSAAHPYPSVVQRRLRKICDG